MLHVVQAVPEQTGDMSIQAIKDLPAILARLHQPHLPQRPQVMRDRGFAQADCFGQRADVLFALDQDGNDAHTTGVTKSPKQLGDVRGRVFVERNGF